METWCVKTTVYDECERRNLYFLVLFAVMGRSQWDPIGLGGEKSNGWRRLTTIMSLLEVDANLVTARCI